MAAILLLDEEDEEAFELIKITRRMLRDTTDPFTISENEFRRLYRLTKDTTCVLIEELVSHMPQDLVKEGSGFFNMHVASIIKPFSSYNY